MTGEGLARLAVVVVLFCKQVTHSVGRVAATWTLGGHLDKKFVVLTLDVDQQGGVRHYVLLRVLSNLTSLWIRLKRSGYFVLILMMTTGHLPLCPVEVGPVFLLEVRHQAAHRLLVLDAGGVAHSDVVTLEELGSAALTTAGPGAVGQAIVNLLKGHLRQQNINQESSRNCLNI